MPQIQVSLYATLRQYVGGAAQLQVEIAPGQTVRQVLDQLHVPLDQTRIMFINHRAAKPTDVLQGGQRLDVFPGIGGG